MFILYQSDSDTVKPLYNVILYNRIFTIQHKFVGNGSISIKIPSLLQNIHLTTPTVSSGKRYTFSIENIFIITEFLRCVSPFGDQDNGLLHEKVSVTFEKMETFGFFMQYEIELMFTFGIIAFKFICTIFSFIK